MATKNLHFETLQLHVGQEQPDLSLIHISEPTRRS